MHTLDDAPPEGGIPPLAPHDTIALLQHNVRHSSPTESIDDEQAMELAKAVNGVPLAIKLVSGIYNPKHRDTFAFLSQLKERISSPGDGVPNIIQIIVEIALDSAPISESPECPRLLSILSFLPEGVPHYKSILHQLTPHFFDVDAAASILLQTCLAQEMSAGALTLLPSIRRVVGKSRPIDEEVKEDLRGIMDFVYAALMKDEEELMAPALLLGLPNTFRIFDYFLDNEASIVVANKALNVAAVLAKRKGQVDKKTMEKIIRVFESLQDTSVLGRCYHCYSRLLYDLSRSSASREMAEKSLELYESIPDELGMGTALIDIGLACAMADDHGQALKAYERGSKIFERLGDEVRMARCSYGMGCLGA